MLTRAKGPGITAKLWGLVWLVGPSPVSAAGVLGSCWVWSEFTHFLVGPACAATSLVSPFKHWVFSVSVRGSFNSE